MILPVLKAAATLYTDNPPAVVFSGLFALLAPPGTDAPFVVMTTQSSAENDSFTTDNATVRMAFNVYTDKALGLGDSAAYVDAIKTLYHRAVQDVESNGVDYRVSFERTGGFIMPHEAKFIQSVEQYTARVWTL